jgi:hypothetical protein|tara:strand:- start:331 stop:540 length:210 start_codon:yes stop_codon:yes gene_type:complete
MKSMKRLLRMTHLATSQPVEVELTDAEMTLSKAIDDASWEIMCNSIEQRTGIEIIGQMELDTLGGRPLH